jgi:hypothetical protein
VAILPQLEAQVTKQEAKAIIKCRIEVLDAINECAEQLSDEQLEYFNNCWGADLLKAVEGVAAGSAPINVAMPLVWPREATN